MEQATKNTVGEKFRTLTVRKDTGRILTILKKCYGTTIGGLIEKMLYQCYGEITEETLQDAMNQLHHERLNEVLEKLNRDYLSFRDSVLFRNSVLK